MGTYTVWVPTDFVVSRLMAARPDIDLSSGCHAVVIYALWSTPGRWVFHSCDELAGELPRGRVTFHFIEADASVAEFAPQLPLVVVVREGQEIDRRVGAVPKPTLKQWLLLLSEGCAPV
ncbi:hypothetical protein JT358_07850 [Micrococcales bacterium 31B]|nr:hypothetical protein [Micrococcales bacterium 31B]